MKVVCSIYCGYDLHKPFLVDTIITSAGITPAILKEVFCFQQSHATKLLISIVVIKESEITVLNLTDIKFSKGAGPLIEVASFSSYYLLALTYTPKLIHLFLY